MQNKSKSFLLIFSVALLCYVILFGVILNENISNLPPDPKRNLNTKLLTHKFGNVTQIIGAKPDVFWVLDDPIIFYSDKAIQIVQVDADLVWQDAYLLSLAEKRELKWKPIRLKGDEKIEGRWFKNTAKTEFTINKEDLGNSEIDRAGATIIAYSCNKKIIGWDCHNDKWMILVFDIMVK